MFIHTTSEVAREARVTSATIRKYADLGLLEFVTTSNGVRLFKPGQTDKVREIYKQRLALRGRRAS